jgi:DNA polymerase III epsilon subunit-like protein
MTEVLMTLHEKKMKLQVLSQGIMVDVEAAGRAPSLYSLLSIGATLISNPSARFYIELCPDKAQYEKEAIRAIGHDDLSYFYRYGVRPSEALSCFATWVQSLRLTSPLFVAHNAAFDWMFYLCYMVAYGIENPFGYKPFDTASAYGHIMTTPIPHHAGEDSYIQTMDLRRYYGMV